MLEKEGFERGLPCRNSHMFRNARMKVEKKMTIFVPVEKYTVVEYVDRQEKIV